MLGGAAGAAVRVLVTITGEPGNLNEEQGKHRQSYRCQKAKSWHCGVVTHWECPLSVWPKRIGRFKKLRLAVVRLRKPYDAESIGVAKNLNEWLTPPLNADGRHMVCPAA
jgi:hypothetical protein